MQMNRRTILWIVIAVLFVATLFISFKAGSGGSVVQTAQTATQTLSSSSNAMVGGC